MAIVSKYVSAKEIYERVMSRTGQQYELSVEDSQLAIAEIMDILGLQNTYHQRIVGSLNDSRYAFTNYTVPLPCDFYKLMPSGIAVNGNPVRWRTNSFHYLKDSSCCNLDVLNSGTLDIFTDNFGNEFSPSIGTSSSNASIYGDVTFDINDDQITFNIKEGDACIAYLAYPLDKDGFLLIPDNAKYKRAVTNYLIWMNDYILWRQNAISDKVYQESKNESAFAIAAASSQLKMPDENQMESLKSTLIRLLPKVNSYNHFFKDLGQQESRPLR